MFTFFDPRVVRTKSEYLVNDYDPGIVDESHYSIASGFLRERAKDRLFVDLGCGVGALWMEKAVHEHGGTYMGVDIRDLSNVVPVFLQADLFSFMKSIKDDRKVNYIINSLDESILSRKSREEFIDLLLKTTDKYILTTTGFANDKKLFNSPDFDVFDHFWKPEKTTEYCYVNTFLYVRK